MSMGLRMVLFIAALLCASPGWAQPLDGHALVLDVKGAIGPASADYVVRALARADEEGAALVILRMDTPGGLDVSMRDIIKKILSSPVPVATYVAPSGSRAASAGTYILFASHIAAMAPATNLGSATPVQLGGLPGMAEKPQTPPSGREDAQHPGAIAPQTAMQRKIINDAAAYIKGLALRHKRNAQWAEQAVREAVNLNADEALQQHVIDIVATDIDDLLRQIDGRRVQFERERRRIDSAHLQTVYLQPDWRSRLLSVITDPNVAYLLMMIGMYGLIFELANPGYVLPGVLGAISLLLALYAFQVLPVNYAGLALILLGVGFMVAEAFVPSFGALGLGGVSAFVIGSVILFDGENLGISFGLIGALGLGSALFFIWIVARLYKMRHRQTVTGEEGIVGSVGEAMAAFDTTGRVWVNGSSWSAQTEQPLIKGQDVQVTAIEGLHLKVKPLAKEK